MTEMMEYGAMMWGMGLIGLLGIAVLVLLLAAFVKRLLFPGPKQSLQPCR